jgi:hypothetical protein
MRKVNEIPSALKHGGYATTLLLPGENPNDFKKLHRDLVDELSPTGPLEDDVVFAIARLVWRKQHLGTFQLAREAEDRREAIKAELRSKVDSEPGYRPPMVVPLGEHRAFRPEILKEIQQQAESQAQKECGISYEVLSSGRATVDFLLAELAVEERLDALIEKNLKRLLLLRGVKSLSKTSETSKR